MKGFDVQFKQQYKRLSSRGLRNYSRRCIRSGQDSFYRDPWIAIILTMKGLTSQILKYYSKSIMIQLSNLMSKSLCKLSHLSLSYSRWLLMRNPYIWNPHLCKNRVKLHEDGYRFQIGMATGRISRYPYPKMYIYLNPPQYPLGIG